MDRERVVAVGLLTEQDLNLLGPTFTRVWPVDETPCFTGLLEAINEADREFRESKGPADFVGRLTALARPGSCFRENRMRGFCPQREN